MFWRCVVVMVTTGIRFTTTRRTTVARILRLCWICARLLSTILHECRIKNFFAGTLFQRTRLRGKASPPTNIPRGDTLAELLPPGKNSETKMPSCSRSSTGARMWMRRNTLVGRVSARKSMVARPPSVSSPPASFTRCFSTAMPSWERELQINASAAALWNGVARAAAGTQGRSGPEPRPAVPVAHRTDEIDALFDEIDTNRDGVLTRDEFRIALEKMRSLDLSGMKRQLVTNDISFRHRSGLLGRTAADAGFDPWRFVKGLPEHSRVEHLLPPAPCLPERDAGVPPLTLVLDMDETLLHCAHREEPPVRSPPPDFGFEMAHGDGDRLPLSCWLRPRLEDFLERIRGGFEVVVFTASDPAYANPILDRIDPEGVHFHHRLFRDSCLPVGGALLKDLSVLGRDLSKVVLVDDKPHVFGYQLDNGIPIAGWHPRDRTDRELEKLEWFLRDLRARGGDVRELVRSKFGCRGLVDEAVL